MVVVNIPRAARVSHRTYPDCNESVDCWAKQQEERETATEARAGLWLAGLVCCYDDVDDGFRKEIGFVSHIQLAGCWLASSLRIKALSEDIV